MSDVWSETWFPVYETRTYTRKRIHRVSSYSFRIRNPNLAPFLNRRNSKLEKVHVSDWVCFLTQRFNFRNPKQDISDLFWHKLSISKTRISESRIYWTWWFKRNPKTELIGRKKVSEIKPFLMIVFPKSDNKLDLLSCISAHTEAAGPLMGSCIVDRCGPECVILFYCSVIGASTYGSRLSHQGGPSELSYVIDVISGIFILLLRYWSLHLWE